MFGRTSIMIAEVGMVRPNIEVMCMVKSLKFQYALSCLRKERIIIIIIRRESEEFFKMAAFGFFIRCWSSAYLLVISELWVSYIFV